MNAPANIKAPVTRSTLEGKREPCAIQMALQQLTSKWACWTILVLMSKPYRFNELRREIDGVSQRMLAATLVDLGRNGLISRRVLATKPPTVEYSLTDLGRSLLPFIESLMEWWTANKDQIENARRIYDESH